MRGRVEPRIFKGARDFPPEEMVHRERIVETVRRVFQKFGFAPLETPAIEYLEVLSGKYGEDADRLIYRLNYKTDTRDETALRYDLTVPLSRFIAMNPNLVKPFKRYQIQPVWRADRPQPRQGRFREFYQCDVDTIGTDSLMADAEMIAMSHEILSALGFEDILIRVNDRKLLTAVVRFVGVKPERAPDVLRSLDKLDKTSFESVSEELTEKGIAREAIGKLRDIVQVTGDAGTMLPELAKLLAAVPGSEDAIRETETLLEYVSGFEVPEGAFRLDLSLARGLDYYTGPIYETVLPKQPHIGSLTGGGRYDHLIGMFSGTETPATGTSIGLDRIFSAMKQLKMVERQSTRTQVFVTVFSEKTRKKSQQIATLLRRAGVNSELALDVEKLKKQFGFADKKGIAVVLVIGDDEVREGKITVKHLGSGEQVSVDENALLDHLKKFPV